MKTFMNFVGIEKKSGSKKYWKVKLIEKIGEWNIWKFWVSDQK